MAHEHAGQSIIEMMWDQLDIQYANLMRRRDEEDFVDADSVKGLLEDGLSDPSEAEEVAEQLVSYFKLKGKVAGLAYAIAKLRNPLNPNLDAIREECAERYVPPADDEEDEDE